MKSFKFKRLFKLILGSVIAIYVLCIFINQQKVLNSYNKEQKYIAGKIQEQTEYKQELSSLKENVDSPEYIESIAREKLDMYLPNESVYIVINK